MEYGYIKVKVEEMRLKKEISKNKLCYAAELERKQLNADQQHTASSLMISPPFGSLNHYRRSVGY